MYAAPAVKQTQTHSIIEEEAFVRIDIWGFVVKFRVWVCVCVRVVYVYPAEETCSRHCSPIVKVPWVLLMTTRSSMIVRAPTTTLAPSSAEHSHTLTHNTHTHTHTHAGTICYRCPLTNKFWWVKNQGMMVRRFVSIPRPEYIKNTHTHTHVERDWERAR